MLIVVLVYRTLYSAEKVPVYYDSCAFIMEGGWICHVSLFEENSCRDIDVILGVWLTAISFLIILKKNSFVFLNVLNIVNRYNKCKNEMSRTSLPSMGVSF